MKTRDEMLLQLLTVMMEQYDRPSLMRMYVDREGRHVVAYDEMFVVVDATSHKRASE